MSDGGCDTTCCDSGGNDTICDTTTSGGCDYSSTCHSSTDNRNDEIGSHTGIINNHTDHLNTHNSGILYHNNHMSNFDTSGNSRPFDDYTYNRNSGNNNKKLTCCQTCYIFVVFSLMAGIFLFIIFNVIPHIHQRI